MPDEADKQRAEFERASAQAQRVDSSIREIDTREAARSRSWIVRAVILIWCVTVIACVALLALTIWMPAAGTAEQDLLELIKIAVLPLTTLVLGFYLSRAK